MRAPRILLALGTVTILCPFGAVAVDGVNEINQTSIIAAGGFPYTISAPGSYVLTSDLAAPLGTGALVLGVGDVEINLNGFTVSSPGGAAAIGIDSAGLFGLTVRRGVVTGFGGAAISGGAELKVIETKLTGNGAGVVGAVTCLVVMNNIVSNSGDGVRGNHCKIENNVIEANTAVGIVGLGNVIVHNRIGSNGGGGILDVGASTIQQNVITANTGFGISDGAAPAAPPVPPPPAPGRTDIIGNTISDTLAGAPVGGRGISFLLPVLIRDNTISGNFANGAWCGAGCVVTGNSVNQNNMGVVPGAGGVTVAAGSTVHGNSISYNTGFGLALPAAANASYTNNTMVGNVPGPNVASPATITGGFGNVCVPAVCP